MMTLNNYLQFNITFRHKEESKEYVGGVIAPDMITAINYFMTYHENFFIVSVEVDENPVMIAGPITA